VVGFRKAKAYIYILCMLRGKSQILPARYTSANSTDVQEVDPISGVSLARNSASVGMIFLLLSFPSLHTPVGIG